jgi:hypothetical protein
MEGPSIKILGSHYLSVCFNLIMVGFWHFLLSVMKTRFKRLFSLRITFSTRIIHLQEC